MRIVFLTLFLHIVNTSHNYFAPLKRFHSFIAYVENVKLIGSKSTFFAETLLVLSGEKEAEREGRIFVVEYEGGRTYE